MRYDLGMALGGLLALSSALGCTQTTISERNVGVPTTRVREDLLPGPAELEALVSRNESGVELELSRVRWCRRQQITTVEREKVEQSRVSLGTGIATGVIMGVGFLTTSVAVFAVGAGVLGIGLLGTGTTTTPLPPEETRRAATREVCQRSPASGVLVRVSIDDVDHDTVSDERGKLVIAGATSGKLEARVDDQPIRIRKKGTGRETSPNQPTQPGTATDPVRAQAPPPPQKQPLQQPAPPKSSQPKQPAEALPLPPPPPPPPGVRLLPQ